jgi:hypothetical protein
LPLALRLWVWKYQIDVMNRLKLFALQKDELNIYYRPDPVLSMRQAERRLSETGLLLD